MFDYEIVRDDAASEACPVQLAAGVAELDDLGQMLSLVGKVDWDAFHAEHLLDVMADLEVLRSRLDAIAVGVTSKVDSSHAPRAAGYRNAAGVLKSELGLPGPEASRRTTFARRVRNRASMEAVQASFLEGRIGFAQASLIAKYSVRDEVSWAFDEAVESFFLPIAEAKPFKFFENACREWFAQRDLTQGEARDRRQDGLQKVRVSTSFDGMVRLDGWLPTVAGEVVSLEFERLRRHLYDLDWQRAKDRLGRDPLPDELGRTADERSVAVLVLMAQRSASLGDSPVTALPCVNITMDYETFVAASSELVGLPALYPAGGVCRTELGIAVSPRNAVEVLLEGHIRRVVFGPDGHVLDFGRKDRFFTRGLREAIMFRNRECVVPGCDVPARFCEIDHCTSWSDLGHTSEPNGDCKCRFHNGLKGPRSADPIINPQSGMVGFHVDPHTTKCRDRLSPARKRRARAAEAAGYESAEAASRMTQREAKPHPAPPEPRTQTDRNQC